MFRENGTPLLSIGDPVSLKRVHQELSSKDWFMTLLDVKEYIAAKEHLFAAYENQDQWVGQHRKVSQ